MPEWWNTPKTALGISSIGLGGGAVLTWFPPQIGIPEGVLLIGLGFCLLMRAYKRRANIKKLVEELQSLTIFDDIQGGIQINATKVLYQLRDMLAIGISVYEVQADTVVEAVVKQLNLRKIVQLEQRRKQDGTRQYDEGYWVRTERGKEVISYLQVNKQVLDKEASQTE